MIEYLLLAKVCVPKRCCKLFIAENDVFTSHGVIDLLQLQTMTLNDCGILEFHMPHAAALLKGCVLVAIKSEFSPRQ